MDNILSIASLRLHAGHLYDMAGRTGLVEFRVGQGGQRSNLAWIESDDGIDALDPSRPISALIGPDWVARCLVGGRGDDPLADLLAALPVALQILAGWPVHRAQVLDIRPDRVRAAVPWHGGALIRAVLRRTVDYLGALISSEGGPGAAAEIAQRQEIARVLEQGRVGGLTPEGLRFGLAAAQRNLPFTMLNGRVLQVGWGSRAHQFKSTFTGRSPSIGEQLARAKSQCNLRLARAALPVPKQKFVRTPEAARAAAAEIGWPVVVKPATLDQGQGIHMGVSDRAALDSAFAAVEALDTKGVLVEEFVPGQDYRLLVVKDRLVAAARRIPGGVTGDGQASVVTLLERLNADPRRGTDKRSILMRIKMDAEARACLADADLTPDGVPELGRFVALRRTPNISTGGTAEDVTDRVHPENRMAALRAARVVGLDVAGVDFLCPDIGRSFRETGGAICEVNSQPGLRPHWLGDPDGDVSGRILDTLLEGRDVRIPTAAITGSKGKTTTAMMLHHIWQTAGYTAGVCSTAGTWVGAERIDTQNLTGVPGAVMLFGDPAVESAVLEMPRKGLIVYGHACPRYDVAALTNVHHEHIGQDGIETEAQMADLKGEVLQRARTAIVVDAENPDCLRVARNAAAPRHILAALDPATPALAAHLEAGGDGVFVASHEGRDWITLARGSRHVPVLAVDDIPAAMGGQLAVNVRNAMFAAALADAQSLPGRAIREGLASFENSREFNPGRFNVVEGFPFEVIVDYAHTPEGVSQLCQFLAARPVSGKRSLALRILGNSGPAKLTLSAPDLVSVFDRIVVMGDMQMIRKYGYFTGPDPMGDMLKTSVGVLSSAAAEAGRDVEISGGAEVEPILEDILSTADAGDGVVLMADPATAFAAIDRRLDPTIPAAATP